MKYRSNAATRLAALAIASSATLAFTTPSAIAGPAVTVYTSDLGFVRETRTFELKSAGDTLRLADLPLRLDPTSLRFVPEGGARVTRLAYRGDVAGGDRALELARGTRVRIGARDGRVVEGELVAVDGNWLMVKADDGSVIDVARTAVEEVRMTRGAALGVVRPTLEVAFDGARTGRNQAELAYLTGGLSWSTEHVVVRKGSNAAEWSAGVSIHNQSGSDFVDAQLKLVAGEPRRGAPGKIPVMSAARMEMASGIMAEDLYEEPFSEYHLYTLPRPATLRDSEVQRLVMLEAREVKVAQRYLYRAGREVLSQLELKNAKANGLGVPLAGGRVRVYEPDATGAIQFTGESQLRHTPVDETFTVDVGAAFDLVAERTVRYDRRLSDRERETSVEIKLRNRKKEGVTIVVEEPMAGDWEMTESTHKFEKKDARTAKAEVPVAAGAEVVVRYAARLRF
jgi:hypothetical protein